MIIDIAFNGTDSIFEKNIEQVMERARNANVMPIIVSVDLNSSKKAIEMALKYNTFCYFGIHPLHFNYEDIKNINLEKIFYKLINSEIKEVYRDNKEFNNINQNNESNFDQINYKIDLLKKNNDLNNKKIFDISDKIKNINFTERFKSVLAIGECGLDYYRASNKEEQIDIFKKHFSLGKKLKLPFFLHCRAAFNSFNKIENNIKGVVHSFDGSIEEMIELVKKGFYIGLNGCSTKTLANIEMIKHIPLDKILLETDSPYCCIRKSYESQKYTKQLKIKNNEPCYIKTIAEVVAKIKNINIKEFENIILNNTLRLFPEIKNKINYWRNN